MTLLRLPRKTPFCVRLSDEPLQWAIDHSREWRVAAGDELTRSALGPHNFRMLPGGGWQVAQGATAPSHLMHIRRADLQQMRRQRGFGPCSTRNCETGWPSTRPASVERPFQAA